MAGYFRIIIWSYYVLHSLSASSYVFPVSKIVAINRLLESIKVHMFGIFIC